MKKSLILSLASLLTAGLALGGVALQGKQAQALGATASSDSYGESTLDNSNFTLTTTRVIKGSLTLDGNSAHPWKFSNGLGWNQYLVLACDEGDAATTKTGSISNYDSTDTDADSVAMKAIYVAANTCESEATTRLFQTLWMDYDISSFSDITFFIHGYADALESVKYLRNLIVYSTDSGATYTLLTNQLLRDSTAAGTNTIDVYKVSALSSAIPGSYTKIRFAYVSFGWAIGTETRHITGISINAKADFEKKLDVANLCTASTMTKNWLAAEYGNMESTDKSALATDACTDDASSNYRARYTYLLNAWAKGSSAATLTVIGNPDATAIWTISVISVLGVATWAGFVLIHSRKKHLER